MRLLLLFSSVALIFSAYPGAFLGLGQAFVGRSYRVVTIVVIPREDMEMEVKGMLIARRLIVIASGDTVTVVGLLHCQRCLLGNIEDAMAFLAGNV